MTKKTQDFKGEVDSMNSSERKGKGDFDCLPDSLCERRILKLEYNHKSQT